MECTGEADERIITPSHPGVPLNEPAAGADPDRTVPSEHHAMRSRTGTLMVRIEEYWMPRAASILTLEPSFRKWFPA